MKSNAHSEQTATTMVMPESVASAAVNDSAGVSGSAPSSGGAGAPADECVFSVNSR